MPKELAVAMVQHLARVMGVQGVMGMVQEVDQVTPMATPRVVENLQVQVDWEVEVGVNLVKEMDAQVVPDLGLEVGLDMQHLTVQVAEAT